MNIKKSYLLYILYIISSININLKAKLEFINRDASITLKPSDSRLKFSSINNVRGWKEESIILETGYDNSWLSPNMVFGDEVGDTAPPTHLLYNDSNAIVNIDEFVVENSNAIVNLQSDINENSQAIVTNANNINYNSQAIVTNRSDIDTNTQNILFNSNAIVDLKEFVTENSNAILGLEEFVTENSNAIVNLQSDINENSQAIVTNANNINYNSQAIVTNRSDIDTNTQNIIFNSNAIVDLKEFATENSNAIVNLEEITADLIVENSNAIVNISEDVNENSQAIVTNANDIYENSWAILDLNNRMLIVQLVIENSNAIIQSSNAIVNLDMRVTENSNAIVNNSWAIADLNNQIHENSWAIQNLIEHGEAIELVAQNSNAIFSASQSIAYLNQEVNENSNAIVNNQYAIINNSQAIVNLNQYIIDNSNFIEDNSWSILALLDKMNQNSYAIINNDEQIAHNSAALITCCNNAEELIQQNSNAIVNLQEDINENSSAIVINNNNINYNSQAIVTNAQNILYNSQAIATLEEITGDLIIENSNAIVDLKELVVENSNAILNIEAELSVENSNAIINLQEDIHENSQAIVFIYSVGTELSVQNSNAIVNNSSFIYQELVVQNSDAIVNIGSSPLVKGPLTIDITIDKSTFIHPKERIYVAGNITIDGQGSVIYFAGKERPVGPQFVVAAGRSVTLKNIKFVGLVSDTFLMESNQSQIVIGENVTWEITENITFTRGFINLSGQNVWRIQGIGGQKLLKLAPFSFVNNPMLNLGLSTLALENIEFTGLEYLTYQQAGSLTGALGLIGNTAVNVEKSNSMVFYIESLANTFRLLENNLTFNGLLNYANIGDNVLHFDFVLRSPAESFDAKTQLEKGKVPVINFATNFIYLTSTDGIARLIFDDVIVKVNNQADAFVVIENSYLGANKLQISGDPIWDASSETAKNRFAIEAIELEAVGFTSDIIPEFGIPIIVDPGHHRSIINLNDIKTEQDLFNILNKVDRPKSVIQFEKIKKDDEE
ncbi:MAG: hypothetical protein ABIA74_01160 [bacterium]